MTEVVTSFYLFKIVLEYEIDNQFSTHTVQIGLEITEHQSKMLYTINRNGWNVSKP